MFSPALQLSVYEFNRNLIDHTNEILTTVLIQLEMNFNVTIVKFNHCYMAICLKTRIPLPYLILSST